MDKVILDKLNTFLDSFEHTEDVVGCLVCGSYVTGNPNAHSDLDVHLILKEGVGYRERGNRIIDGLLIEYFSNSKKQILAYFEDDYKSISPMSQTQFVTGEIIFDKTGEVLELKEIAKSQMAKKYADVNTEVSGIGLYAIWDSVDDLEAMYEDNRADFEFVYYNRLNMLLKTYFWTQKIPYNAKTILGHIENPTTRRKYLLDEIEDQELKDLVKTCITDNNRKNKLDAYKTIANKILEQGDFDISTFAFKSAEEV